MYQFRTKTTLMKNQKAAQVLSDQSKFSVLQTSLGQSLFFSIGDENILYLSAEQDNVKTGWTPIDLTSEIGQLFPAKTVTAKLFAVSQDGDSGTIAIAQAVHVAEDAADYLFVMSGLSDAPDASWMSPTGNRTWVARPYDGATMPVAAPNIGYLYLSARQSSLLAGLQDPKTGYFQNYTVALDSSVTTGVWTAHMTAENFDAPPSLALGKPQAAMYAGLYQLATLAGQTSLTFTALKALFTTPTVIKFTVPQGASAIATLPDGATDNTDLYIAGNQSIYLLTAGAQTNFAEAPAIIADARLTNVSDLKVHAGGGWVVIWARCGDQGQLLYARCPAGSETDASHWSALMPIQATSVQLASRCDRATGTNVLYAHLEGDELIQLTQDPVTTQWRARSILLPHLAVSDMVERYTFTTHITVLDSNNIPIAGQSFPLTSTSPCTVYIDDLYTTLSNTDAATLVADASGTISIVQVTESLGAVCYNLTAGDGSIVNINPMQASLAAMQGISTGADLSAVTVTDERGNRSPLVPSSVSGNDKDAAAKAIKQLVGAAAVLPPDGSVAPTSARAGVAPRPSWSLSFADREMRYIDVAPEGAWPGAGDDAIDALAGDVLRWMEQAVEDVESLSVKVEDDVIHAWVTFENATYHFLVRCHDDLLHTLQFVYAKIKVLIEDLVRWLGFIFEWNDILRTHKVLKNFMRQYASSAVTGLQSAKADLNTLFGNLEKQIDALANLPATTGTFAGYSAAATPTPGLTEPQSHWGVHQLKANVSGAASSYTPPVPGGDALEKILNEVLSSINQEATDIMAAVQAIKTEIVDPFPNLTVSEIITRLLAIVADLGLESIQTVLTSVIGGLQILIQGASDVIDQPIDIPVLSPMYKEYASDDLSFLDVACLVSAIPVTIAYKLARGATPFPDDATTRQLIDAPDFATIIGILDGEENASRPGAAVTEARVISDVLNIAGVVGAALTAFFGVAKAQAPTNVLLAGSYAVAYLLYVAPDIPTTDPTKQPWWQQMNGIITGVSVVKTFVDISLSSGSKGGALVVWEQVSPVLEAVINFLWQLPTSVPIVPTENYTPDGAAIIGFLGGTSFDVGGILTPETSELWQPDMRVRELFVTGQTSCALLYGLACLMLVLVPSSSAAIQGRLDQAAAGQSGQVAAA